MNRTSTLLISLAAGAGLLVTACGDDDKGGSSGDFCTLAREFNDSNAETDDIFTDEPSADELKKTFETLDEQIAAMVNAAPAEIKADAKTVQDGLQVFIDVMADADYDLSVLFTDPDVAEQLAVLDSDEFNEASENLDEYLKTTCGISVES